MHAELHFTPHATDESTLRDKTVVVIDVLRATTSIAAALGNGAREIIPVTTVESAMKISANLFGDVILLGGERNGKMIEGFNLGNSPFDYTEEKVKGKSIIFSSTNGSQAMVKARYAREMALCAFVNISAVVKFLLDAPRDFTIVCSGTNGMFSMEDSVCAGMILSRLVGDDAAEVTMSDGARAALLLHKAEGKNILRMLQRSQHGVYLKEIGFGDDLGFCAKLDAVPVLPQLDGNVIRLKREAERKDAASDAMAS